MATDIALLTIQEIKDQYKDNFDSFNIAHQDWAINQIIALLKSNGYEIAELVFATNAEVSKWLKEKS